jgi:hypothetical protein
MFSGGVHFGPHDAINGLGYITDFTSGNNHLPTNKHTATSPPIIWFGLIPRTNSSFGSVKFSSVVSLSLISVLSLSASTSLVVCFGLWLTYWQLGLNGCTWHACGWGHPWLLTSLRGVSLSCHCGYNKLVILILPLWSCRNNSTLLFSSLCYVLFYLLIPMYYFSYATKLPTLWFLLIPTCFSRVINQYLFLF